MNKDFRERVFLPLMLPLGVVLVILLVAGSLSRVLLAVPEAISTFTALLAAGYVLLVAGLVASRPRISSSALGVGVVVGLVAVVAAGAVGANAGIRDLHHGEDEHAAEEGEEGEDGADGDQAAGEEIPEDAHVFVAVDIDYSDAPDTIPAGSVTIAIDNQGAIHHDVAFDELGGEVVAEADGGQVGVGEVTLEPGTYTYFCTVPGHRPAGMEGTLQVE
jgi:plastocyanin